MVAINKRSREAFLCHLILIAVICHYSATLNSRMTSPVANRNLSNPHPAEMSNRQRTHSLNEAFTIERGEKDSEVNPTKGTPSSLKEILSRYFKGSDFVSQERAFKRVIRWKGDFEDIARKYDNLDWKMLSAIIKAETQGRTGKQVSYAKAVGMPQIKYQGAWAFVWDAMFSEKIMQGSIFVKDYYNSNIRARYSRQLNQIRRYLEDNSIIVHPANLSEEAYRRARSDSWENLKMHLKRVFKPGEYQVAVDIAAMYIDHLINILCKIEKQVSEIKQHFEHKGIISLDDIELSGTKMTRWQRIKKHLGRKVKFMGDSTGNELTLAHLSNILERLQDPNLYSAAYNFGIRKVLEYIESGKKLPNEVEQYVKEVSNYKTIFSEIDEFRLQT